MRKEAQFVEHAVSQLTRQVYVHQIGSETQMAIQANLTKFQAVLRWVGSGRLVLDMGCNDGALGREIRALGNRVIGCDFPEFAALTRLNYGLDAVACDLTKPLPFASEKVDVIVAVGIMEYIPNDRGFLAECHRVLKPGGELVLTVLNVASFVNRMLLLRGKNIDHYPNDLVVVRRYTIKELDSLLREVGFQIVKLQKCPGRYQGRSYVYTLFEKILPASFSTELAYMSRKV